MAIAGNLPWGNSGAGALGGNPASAYASAYNDALNMNKQNYTNILQGYNDTSAQQQSRQQGITQGYGQLSGDVMGLIAGTDAAQRQAIADQYQANRGQASQSLIDRGLGNTTVQSAVDRGLQYDRSKSEVNLSNQFAQLNAQYRTQLGLAGLDYQNQANMQNTALASQQLGWMNSVNAGYPNAAMYQQLAQMQGANKVGALPMSGALGGGTVTWDKKPTPSPGAQAGSAFSYGPSFGHGGVQGSHSASQSVYPDMYSYDPADPFWSSDEGQNAGGGTMGYGYDPNSWINEQDAQMGGGEDWSSTGGEW